MDIEQFKNALNKEFKSEEDKILDKKLDSLLIKDGVDYPEPRYLLNFHGQLTIPRGNIVAVSAKWKNGKTFLCDLLCAVFLGSRRFADFSVTDERGDVLYFDTEQDMSDTARIRNIICSMIPQQNYDKIHVINLRSENITAEQTGDMGRYDIIAATIKRYKPALVVVDGIADLIYNFNDVIESQLMVNNLAALASEHDCAIITVMHQNKGMHDNAMKGHLGTLLNQKASDVFQIRKVEDLFAVSHPVSRHRNISDFYFTIDQDGAPAISDATREEVRAMEQRSLSQSDVSLNDRVLSAEECNEIFSEQRPVKSCVLVKFIESKYNCGLVSAYKVINNSLEKGIIEKEKGLYVRIK